MANASTGPDTRQLIVVRHHSATLRSILGICGSMIALLGVVLAMASASTDLDGGDFFLFAGFGLIASGALLAKRHAAGAWTYMAVFAATLAWSLHDSGLGGSPVGYRIAGPIIMLVVIALLMPALLHWSRRRTVSVLAALIMATVAAGDLSTTDDRTPANSNVTASQHHGAQTKGVLQ
jgi:glucose dehydrogenase